MNLKNDIEENQIINFINNACFTQYHGGQHIFCHKHILDKIFQENCSMDTLSTISGSMSSLKSISKSSNVVVEIYQGKTLNINSKLEEFQKEKFIKKLQKHSGAFAWEYSDMRGIYPNTCIHHIYIEDNSKPINVIVSFDTTYVHDHSLASITSLFLLVGEKSPFSSLKYLKNPIFLMYTNILKATHIHM
jgi:hypothetical protein